MDILTYLNVNFAIRVNTFIPLAFQAVWLSSRCTPWVKKQDTLLVSITSRNINWFSKFFHC